MVWKVGEEDGRGNTPSRRAATRFSSAGNDATWTTVLGRDSNSATRARIVLAWPLSELVMKRMTAGVSWVMLQTRDDEGDRRRGRCEGGE